MSTGVSPLHMHGLRTRLNQLRMPELRNVLMDLNLARSGRKQELVDRIANELEVCNCSSFLTSTLEAHVYLLNLMLDSSLPIKLEVRRLLPFMRIDYHLA